MKGKKKIRRRPGKPRNMYFTKETGESIARYNSLESKEKKHEIYQKEILPAIEKLAENLIFVYGFKSPYASAQELKLDCVAPVSPENSPEIAPKVIALRPKPEAFEVIGRRNRLPIIPYANMVIPVIVCALNMPEIFIVG